MSDLAAVLDEAVVIDETVHRRRSFTRVRLVNISGTTPELVGIRASSPPASQNRGSAPYAPWDSGEPWPD